jgi:hypothetical protein
LDYQKLSVKVAFTDDWCCFASAENQGRDGGLFVSADEGQKTVTQTPW